MSPRFQRALSFIREYVARCGFPPSHGELRDAMGLRSNGSVEFLIKQLKVAGYVTTIAGTARSMVLTGKDISDAGSAG